MVYVPRNADTVENEPSSLFRYIEEWEIEVAA